jgi:4-amino-4-deoxy-L-arabinose transferase-like glycosyltransferase
LKTAPVAVEKQLLLWIVVLSLAIKVGLMLYIGDRAYPDVVRGAQFGRDLAQGNISIDTHLDNSKTFLGPAVFYWISSAWGLWGLRLFNLVAFASLLIVQYRLGREWFSKWAVLAGVFLLAFYPGSHRTVSFGEPEDNLVSLLMAIGILWLVRSRRPAVAGLFMGLAFLFKFWVAVFIVGFLVHFVWKRQWRELILAGVAAGMPFLILNLASDWAGLRGDLVVSALSHLEPSAPAATLGALLRLRPGHG